MKEFKNLNQLINIANQDDDTCNYLYMADDMIILAYEESTINDYLSGNVEFSQNSELTCILYDNIYEIRAIEHNEQVEEDCWLRLFYTNDKNKKKTETLGFGLDSTLMKGILNDLSTLRNFKCTKKKEFVLKPFIGNLFYLFMGGLLLYAWFILALQLDNGTFVAVPPENFLEKIIDYTVFPLTDFIGPYVVGIIGVIGVSGLLFSLIKRLRNPSMILVCK